jgi:hypothetical protein
LPCSAVKPDFLQNEPVRLEGRPDNEEDVAVRIEDDPFGIEDDPSDFKDEPLRTEEGWMSSFSASPSQLSALWI